MQVHDELIVEAPENEKETVAKLLQEEMENAVKLSVPLTADAAVGRTWYDAKNKINVCMYRQYLPQPYGRGCF